MRPTIPLSTLRGWRDLPDHEIEAKYQAALAAIRSQCRRLSDEDAWRRVERVAADKDEDEP